MKQKNNIIKTVYKSHISLFVQISKIHNSLTKLIRELTYVNNQRVGMSSGLTNAKQNTVNDFMLIKQQNFPANYNLTNRVPKNRRCKIVLQPLNILNLQTYVALQIKEIKLILYKLLHRVGKKTRILFNYQYYEASIFSILIPGKGIITQRNFRLSL